MRVFLALDPETLRVTMQDREFGDGDLPRGLRGHGWSFREGEVSDFDWDLVLAGMLDNDELDELHRRIWTESGASAWPNP